MASLSAVLGVLTSAGERVDKALRQAGGYLPTWIKLGTGLSASAAKNGQAVEITLSINTSAALTALTGAVAIGSAATTSITSTAATYHVIKIDGEGNAIDVTAASTYLSSAVEVEIDAPSILLSGAVSMAPMAAPTAHATRGQLYYSSADGKWHAVASVANGGADTALY